MSTTQKCALIMAGGTGGHIFPGLAVAQALRERGWRVHWLGAPRSMESRLVPPKGFPLELVDFSGVRGKGLRSLVALPWRLLRAFGQSIAVLRRVRPDVVVGLGGYISFPAGLMAALLGKPLVLHEQNSVAGMANKILALVARRVFTAFPNVLSRGQWVGNPLRAEFLVQAEPAVRFEGRTGPLQVLVVGGSLGARALNTVVPQAMALIAEDQRPVVIHQSGEQQLDALHARCTSAANPLYRQHRPGICQGRSGDLPRRRKYRDRVGCRRRCGCVCAISLRGGRPSDPQCPLSGGPGRWLADAAKRADTPGVGRFATKNRAYCDAGMRAAG
jgi:UDP-N-acetylglucosamine--N-acetylmuramyl-(pentapeptide) pyrophosphoryl-undecaprenol N-acetylglucosamine transferase